MRRKFSSLSRSKKRSRKKWIKKVSFFAILLFIIIFSVYSFSPNKESSSKSEKTTKKQQAVSKKQQSSSKKTEKLNESKKTKFSRAREEIDQYLKKIGFSGTAMVVREGEIIINRGYLDANREEKVPNTIDTLYYIGSSQKALTAAAILQLADQKKLNIEDPISKYFPDFPNGNTIKLKNLLNHTSGIVGHKETRDAITPKELVDDIKKMGVKRGPGKWDYKDSNYTILAYLIEKLSGMSYRHYLEKHIFKPARMSQVGFDDTFKDEENKSVGYVIKKNGKYVVSTPPDLSQLYGVGDMYISAQNMYLFDKAIMDRKLLSEESFRQMFTKGSASGYGMGFYNDPSSYNSHGIMSGWNVSNSFSKTGKTYVILFSNIQNNIKSFGKVNNHIYQLLNKSS